MKYLFDTVAISEPFKPNPDQRVLEELSSISTSESCLSVITIGELNKGIHLLPPGKRRKSLEQKLEQLEIQFIDRILEINTTTGRIWGEIAAQVHRQGGRLPVADGLIAATAIEHDLILVTRNVKDFQSTGVKLYNPWEE